MAEKGNALSRNPNICASCSSMADGMVESGMAESPGLASRVIIDLSHDRIEANAAVPAIRHIPT